MDKSNPIESNTNITSLLEALLFVAPGATLISQLATALEIPVAEVEAGLLQLEQQLLNSDQMRGLRLQRHHGRVQLTTPPEAAPVIERFLGLEASSRLSRASLETLAIVAYKEPVTRPQIDAIRGVSSDGVIKNLLSKGLIQEIGRAEAPGRPILYCTTSDFLQHFGLNSLEELPPLPEMDEETSVTA
ncbi:MAG: SMC-Scp complex subunit ScpB [Anaerolineales bacterium]|nr:SMC-Scp complex subunit ScpB [Anaerolineales bacterium]